VYCARYCLCSVMCRVLFERGASFCLICVICVLCVAPLRQDKNPIAVKINNNNNINQSIRGFVQLQDEVYHV
jgi:hypothetical protein